MTDRDRLNRMLFAPQRQIDSEFAALVTPPGESRDESRVVWTGVARAVWRMLRHGR